ncbi:MAG TPA: aldehyde dehydrogenase family protein [Planctomycetota bacterium]|nr:aldehyde dehydrogenase family protein [Planctomycetota bacterium]
MTHLVSRSPWTGAVLGEVPSASMSDCATAVALMAEAGATWRMDAQRRRMLLTNFGTSLIAARSDLVRLLIAEAGKNRVDAEAEADLLPKKIAISLDAGLARTPQTVAGGSEPQTLWRPRGVAVVLGPFNFPLHLLHGLVVPALAVGCTVVAKPSERCPLLGSLYARLLTESALDGVCRVVPGGAEVAQTLIAQPEVTTVAAVGGRSTGLALSNALTGRPEVVLALELGGVNPALVLADADLRTAATAIADGAWRMAGQRCTATRQVHVTRALHGPLIDALRQERQRWLPDGTSEGVNGFLINAWARERFIADYIYAPAGLAHIVGDATRTFADSQCVEPLLHDVRDPSVRTHGLYREEHFGPGLIVDAYDDLDECVARLAANPYRLAASVFTASRERFLALAPRLPYGQVNHNRPTAGARSDQPFGGLGMAGNARPAALAAGSIFADESVVW